MWHFWRTLILNSILEKGEPATKKSNTQGAKYAVDDGKSYVVATLQVHYI